MITKDQAINARMFYHVELKNKDGTSLRARRNGKTKTWKTPPDVFRVPVKYGLYDYGYITQSDAFQFTTEE